MGRPYLAADERFATPMGQFNPENKEAFNAIWWPWIMERNKADIVKAGQDAHVLCAPLNTIDELVDDPHWAERKFWVEIEHPVVGKATYPGAPIKASEMPWVIRMPAPLLGQYNEEVYGALGYSKEDLVKLRERGVI